MQDGRSATGNLWTRWWESLTRQERRQITSSAHPVNRNGVFNPHVKNTTR